MRLMAMSTNNTPTSRATTIAAPGPTRAAAAAWLPLMLALAWLAATVVGIGPGLANAAQTIVTGTVDNSVQLDLSGCTGSDTLSFGSGIVPGDPMSFTSGYCNIAFGANNSSSGATLQVMEDPAVASGAAMKCVSATCTGDSIADIPAGSAAPGAGSSAFGVALASAGAATGDVWAVSDPDPVLYPVANTASTACQTSSKAIGSCSFFFGAAAKIGYDKPGSYQASVSFVAMAN